MEMMLYRVDRDSPLPAYYQIAQDLRQRIAGGEWSAGGKLPSEPQLAQQYDVSRMTMRQAFKELAKEGVVVRRRGAGTFVSRGFMDITEPSPDGPGHSNHRKAQLRREVWAELRKVARPDSRLHWDFSEFVPDFEGSAACAEAIGQMPRYRESELIFVAPDNSLAPVRAQAVADGKILLVATHALVRGFTLLEPDAVPEDHVDFAATLDGLERYGRPVTLDAIRAMGAIDLLVTGVSVVTEKGVRWGKGHGFFDLEWAMFCDVGAVSEETPVVAVGHDCQVVAADLEPSVVDTIVDVIVTPTRVLEIEPVYEKPAGILWEFISPELRQQIPPLQTLYKEKQHRNL
jgi:5-formyltetrahydrofolate cyclo-ligase